MVLGLSVWLVYLADRLHDARALGRWGSRPPTLRHAFARRHARPLALAWACGLVVNATLAFARLPSEMLVVGTGVLVAAAATALPGLRSRAFGVATRALLVGAAFAGAVAMFLPRPVVVDAAPLLAAFALACAANVLSAARLEVTRDDGAETCSGLRWLAPTSCLIAGGASAIAWAWTGSALGACAATTCLLLLGLQHARRRLPGVVLRALADLALMAPLALLL